MDDMNLQTTLCTKIWIGLAEAFHASMVQFPCKAEESQLVLNGEMELQSVTTYFGEFQ